MDGRQAGRQGAGTLWGCCLDIANVWAQNRGRQCSQTRHGQGVDIENGEEEVLGPSLVCPRGLAFWSTDGQIQRVVT